MSNLKPPHGLKEKLYAARQIIQAVVAAADSGFEHHYALEAVEDILINVAEAIGKASEEESDVNPTHSHLESRRDWGVADNALANAYATVDLLQGAAAHGAIEEPANNESLARVLSVVREQLEDVRLCLWPQDKAADTEDAS